MRARRLCQRLLIVVAGLVALGGVFNSVATAATGDSLPEPICWRQLAFSIPFKVAPVESPDQQPAEVRLYVSANQGVQWELAQHVVPQERNFTFRAPHDGEYWFQIRTADKQGRVSQDVGGRPELRVIVDTMPPRLDLTATRTDDGRVQAKWQAVDPLLNADSLKIEYQIAGGSWRAVAVEHPPTGQNRSTTSGSITWFPSDAPAGSIAVRAQVADQAGNTAVSQALAGMAGAGPHRDLTASNSAAKPAESDKQWISTPNPVWSTSPAPSPSAPLSNSLPTNLPPVNKQLAGDPGATPWPSDYRADQSLGRNPIPVDNGGSSSSFAASQSPSSPYPNRYSEIASRTEERINPPIHNQALPDGNQRQTDFPPTTGSYASNSSSGTMLSIPAASNSGMSGGSANPSGNSSFANMLPPGERPRMVNSRSFDLDYEVDGVGPSGIAKVELWGTRDGGRSWISYGVDNDNRSPIRANVEGEGLYGFRIVVQSGNGIGGLPPHSGDAPDLWVMVDLTKPVVHLIDAKAGDGLHSGELLIRWEASDAALAARPITLLFTDRQGGPWSIIAAGLENSGQYSWRPDSRAPDRIFLRIEARDEAGNVGSFEAAQPVMLDRIRPEGRIRGVRPTTDTTGLARPVEQTATGPKMYDFSR